MDPATILLAITLSGFAFLGYRVWTAHDPRDDYASERGYMWDGFKMMGILDGTPFWVKWYFEDGDEFTFGGSCTFIALPLGDGVPVGLRLTPKSFVRQLLGNLATPSVKLPRIPALRDYVLLGDDPHQVGEWATRPEVERVLSELVSEERDALQVGETELHIVFGTHIEVTELDAILARCVEYSRVLGGAQLSAQSGWKPRMDSDLLPIFPHEL